MKHEMSVGIIGAGHIASIHGPSILKQPNTRIVGVSDRDLVRAEATAKTLNANQFYQEARLLLEEQKPDVVHVLTPPQYHAELSMLAMEYGCHVLVEKPMALNIKEAKDLIKMADQKKVKLCVNHNFVFEKVVQNAKNLVSSGIIGEVVSVETNFLFNAKRYPAILEHGAEYCHWTYRLNGGPLQDLMPHPASLLFEFIPEIKEIQTIRQNRGVVPAGWNDEIRVLINSENIIGYISLSLSEKPDRIVLTIKGTGGTIEADLFNGILTIRRHSLMPRAVIRGLSGFQLSYQYFKGSIRNIINFATGKIDKSGGVEPVISRFYDAIRNGSEIPVSTDKGFLVAELMDNVWPEPMNDMKAMISPSHSTRKDPGIPKAFVTGASGFIGFHLVKKLLSEKISVRALVRPNSIHAGRLKTLDVDLVGGDLTNPHMLDEATKGIQMIYHAGAAMSNSWDEHMQVTLKGTENVINAALANKVDRFVHLSTLAVYELLDINKKEKIGEDSPYQKNAERMGPYAYAKIEAERLILNAYNSQGLKASIVRPGMVIGELGRVFFPHFGYRYADRVFFLIGKGNVVLPFTYVGNTVDGIFKASVCDNAIGKAYNLIDDGEMTAKVYLEKFMEITGIDARIISLPYIVPYAATTAYEVAASLGVLKKGITSRAQLKWKQAPVRFDNSKAKRELEWKPQISLEDGLSRTFKWYAEEFL